MFHVTFSVMQHNTLQSVRKISPSRSDCVEGAAMAKMVFVRRFTFAFSDRIWKKALSSFFPARVSRKSQLTHPRHPVPPQPDEHRGRPGGL